MSGSQFDVLEFVSSQPKNKSGQLDDEKISRLGRAITAQREMLLESYLSYKVPAENLVNNPTYRTLREFGVVLESGGQAKLASVFRKILDNIAQKIHRQHIIPDIEEWKRELKKLSELVNHAETEPLMQRQTDEYLAQIYQLCDDLSDSLTTEMNNIEYAIYAELANTPDLHIKRLILKSLIEKMNAQLTKLTSLSRDELDLCHDDNLRIAQILQLTLLPTIDKALESFSGYLERTMTLLDSINAQLNQNKTHAWRVYKAIKNTTFSTSQVNLSFDDLMAHGLAVHGLDFVVNQHVDVSNNPIDKGLLHEILHALPKQKTLKIAENQSYDDKVQVIHYDKLKQLSKLQQYVFEFLKSNNHKSLADNQSVKTFWQANDLIKIIEFKPFLALILHTFRSDFLNSHAIYKKDDFIWELFLKFAKNPDDSNTKHIIDVRIIHYHQDNKMAVFDFIENWQKINVH